MQPLDLARGGRRGGPGQPLGNAVFQADPLKQHHRRAWLDEPAGKYRPVIAQHFLRDAIGGHRIEECLTDRPGGRTHDRRRQNAVTGVVIDASDDLHLPAIGKKGAGGDIHLPQLHRYRAFPPLAVPPPAAPGPGLDRAIADQHPVDRGAGHCAQAAAIHLEHQPLGTPPPMSPAQLADNRLQLGRDLPLMRVHLMAAISQAERPFLPVTAQPGVHALAADTKALSNLSRRRSHHHFQHRPVPLPGHAQLPQHERKCQASSEAGVSNIKRDNAMSHCLITRCWV